MGRIILPKMSKYSSVTESIKFNLMWPFAEEIHIKTIVLLMYKILFCESSPKLIKDMFTSTNKIHSYRTRSCDLISKPKIRTNYGKKVFQYKGAQIWNIVQRFQPLKECKNVYELSDIINPLLQDIINALK